MTDTQNEDNEALSLQARNDPPVAHAKPNQAGIGTSQGLPKYGWIFGFPQPIGEIAKDTASNRRSQLFQFALGTRIELNRPI